MNLTEHLSNLALPLHQPFVDPILCADLQKFGLNTNTTHQWKIQNGQCFIWCSAYDPDNYYKQATSLIDEIMPVKTLPAYTATDMEKLAGNFLHILHNGSHEIQPTRHTRVGIRRAPRYPDALALIVTELLCRKIIKADQANALLEK